MNGPQQTMHSENSSKRFNQSREEGVGGLKKNTAHQWGRQAVSLSSCVALANDAMTRFLYHTLYIGFETDRPGNMYVKHQCIDGSKSEKGKRVRLFQKIAGDEGGCLSCHVVSCGGWGLGPPVLPLGATAPHGSAIALRSGEPGPQCEMSRV